MSQQKPAWHAIRILMMHTLLEFERDLKGSSPNQIDTMAEQWLKMPLKELGQEMVKRGCPDIFSNQELPDVIS